MLTVESTANINAEHAVCGVAQISNRIFVICLESNIIRVFSDERPHDRLADILIESMDDPNDIAACFYNCHLYVVDWGCHCVWKVADVTSDTPNATKWITEFSPWSISVSTSGRALVTPRFVIDPSGNTPGYLYLYGPHHDDSVETIPLPPGANVEHAVETNRNTIIACYTEVLSAADNENKVNISELGRDGAILRHLEYKRSEGILEWPRHVVILFSPDCDRYSILVTDFNGDRVVECDDQLNLVSVVLTDDCVSKPRRLAYNKSAGTLLVGQYNGVVGVYKLSVTE